MNSWEKGFVLILLLFTVMSGTGCALFVVAGAGAAGVGGAEYIRGELKQAYAASMEKTWDAALTSTEQLKTKVTEKSIDNLDQNRVIKGKTQDGKDFQISLEASAKDVTVVKVRVGIFGDEKYSQEVQEIIAKNLKK